MANASDSRLSDENLSGILRNRDQKQRWIEWALVVGFWLSLFMLNIGQQAFDPRGHHGKEPQGLQAWLVTFTAIEYLVWLLLTPVVFWWSHRFSLERDRLVRRILMHILIAFSVSVVVDAFGHLLFHSLFPGDRGPFQYSLRWILSLRFVDELVIYLVVLAAGFARDYFWRYQDRQAEMIQLKTHTAELQAQLAEARLKALRMQINPHFLFNTLHTISTYLERDPRGVRTMIARLSQLLRYALESTSDQEVPLSKELEFLDGYLEIQRIRFQGNLVIEQTIEPDVVEALVPNLILQPIVENAVKHGVSNLEIPGRIELRAWKNREFLCLSVCDNGPGLTAGGDGASAMHEGVGLQNTRERLESLYGDQQNLSLEQMPEGGFEARIQLPFHTAADLYTTIVPA